MNKPLRNSSLELLRILCILGILCMHLCGIFSTSDNFLTLLQLNAVNSLFNICVSVFILISGYFGITRKLDKMFSLWCIVIFYSILSTIIPLFFGSTPELVFLFKSLFPTITGKYWYFTTYFILWLFSPYLNRICESMSQRQFKLLLSLLVFVFYVFPTCFYFEIIKDNGKGPVNMLIVYLIGRYLSKYPASASFRKKSGFFFLSVAGAFILNLAATLLRNRMFAPFARDNSLFMLCGAVCCFLCFCEKQFHSKFINLLSRNVFAVYISEVILRNLISDYSVITFLDGRWYLFPAVLALAICLFLVLSLIECVRKKLLRYPERMLLKLLKLILRWMEAVYSASSASH